MRQHLSEHQVRGIAKSAHVDLTDDEVAQMTIDLNSVIDTLEPITQYDLEGVRPTFHPIVGLTNVTRADEVAEGLSRAAVLENAPEHQDGCFVVPSILGKRGDR